MDDRQLLEAAARAAGIEGQWGHESYIERHEGFIPTGWLRRWNPLTDDGDALRLAVKLGIEVGNYHQYGRALATIGHTRGHGEFWEVGDDPYAATRRAIVKAAASRAKGV